MRIAKLGWGAVIVLGGIFLAFPVLAQAQETQTPTAAEDVAKDIATDVDTSKEDPAAEGLSSKDAAAGVDQSRPDASAASDNGAVGQESGSGK